MADEARRRSRRGTRAPAAERSPQIFCPVTSIPPDPCWQPCHRDRAISPSGTALEPHGEARLYRQGKARRGADDRLQGGRGGHWL